MNKERIEVGEGWTWLINSPKWHYVRKGMSLCNRFMVLNTEFEQGNDESPDNCLVCRKKRLKEKELEKEKGK